MGSRSGAHGSWGGVKDPNWPLGTLGGEGAGVKFVDSFLTGCVLLGRSILILVASRPPPTPTLLFFLFFSDFFNREIDFPIKKSMFDPKKIGNF